jgi:hypothetical protein
MNESSGSKMEVFRGRIQNMVTRLRRGLPFASGVFAALLVLFFYNLLIVKPNQLTVEDVNISVAIAMASAS